MKVRFQDGTTIENKKSSLTRIDLHSLNLGFIKNSNGITTFDTKVMVPDLSFIGVN